MTNPRDITTGRRGRGSKRPETAGDVLDRSERERAYVAALQRDLNQHLSRLGSPRRLAVDGEWDEATEEAFRQVAQILGIKPERSTRTYRVISGALDARTEAERARAASEGAAFARQLKARFEQPPGAVESTAAIPTVVPAPTRAIPEEENKEAHDDEPVEVDQFFDDDLLHDDDLLDLEFDDEDELVGKPARIRGLESRIARLEAAARALARAEEAKDARRVRRKVWAAAAGSAAGGAIPAVLDAASAIDLPAGWQAVVFTATAAVGAFVAGWATPDRRARRTPRAADKPRPKPRRLPGDPIEPYGTR